MKWSMNHSIDMANKVFWGTCGHAKVDCKKGEGVTLTDVGAWAAANTQELETLMNQQPPKKFDEEMQKL